MSVAADLEVFVLEAVLDVIVDVDVVVAVELVPLFRLERSGSVVNTAVRPVALLQLWFDVPVPVTKLTAAHWNRSALRVLSHY